MERSGGVEVKSAEVEVDHIPEPCSIAIAVRALLERLNTTVDALGGRVRRVHRDGVQNAVQVMQDRVEGTVKSWDLQLEGHLAEMDPGLLRPCLALVLPELRGSHP